MDKGFGRNTLTLLLFRHCKLVRAGLFQVPTSYTVQREKGLLPTRESLSSKTAAFPTLTQRPTKRGFAGDSGSPAAMRQQSLADTLSGKPKSSFVPFPSLYLPHNGTIQQVLNVLMGFRIASVAHLPQGHFTPPWEPGVTAKKKVPVVWCINCLMTECSR